mgnify:CR=1 FL=1
MHQDEKRRGKPEDNASRERSPGSEIRPVDGHRDFSFFCGQNSDCRVLITAIAALLASR